MSQDRVIYSFVVGWVILILLMIALDWLGNPNRGGFRPRGDRSLADQKAHRAERRRQKLEADASVRATLRDAYGASSLRWNWSAEREDRVRQIDNSLIIDDPSIVDVPSREVSAIDPIVADGDPLPNTNEGPPELYDHETETETASDAVDEPEPEHQPEPEPEDAKTPEPEPAVEAAPVAAKVRSRWQVGDDPLAPTAKGSPPAPSTIRSRVWKNLAASGEWSGPNQATMKAGKPPRRRNPDTGKIERAVVDVETGEAAWASDPYALDPRADRE